MRDTLATAALAAQLKGIALTRDDEGYDEARTVWNAMVDRSPAVIARCVSTEDVVAALRFWSSKPARDWDTRWWP